MNVVQGSLHKAALRVISTKSRKIVAPRGERSGILPRSDNIRQYSPREVG